jgi:hypothetical protein
MQPPEPRGGRRSLLGVLAYALVPGERRKRAAGHFRRAGFEVLLGARELARPGRDAGQEPPTSRERIEIE